MPNFYKQEIGLLIPPANVPKWHVSWTLDNILEGFRQFHEENNRWPIYDDLETCKYLPNVKTIQRKFGGIINIRSLLGLAETDYRKGQTRSKKALEIGKRGFSLEQKTYLLLVEKFHEPFVHNQSRVNIDESCSVRVDFVIYHLKGKFAVDVFYPEGDRIRFNNNVRMKYKLYKNFPFQLYLCTGNEQIDDSMIKVSNESAEEPRDKNVKLITYKDFINILGEYTPLKNPYLK